MFVVAIGTNPFSFKNFVAARSANDDDTSDVAKVAFNAINLCIVTDVTTRSSIHLDCMKTPVKMMKVPGQCYPYPRQLNPRKWRAKRKTSYFPHPVHRNLIVIIQMLH